MQAKTISFAKTNAFKDIFLDYVSGAEALRPFYAHLPQLEHFEAAIAQRQNSAFGQNASARGSLVSVLKTQYRSLSPLPTAQIESLLSPDTFTVTTGHQLNIFGGPLFFIYKIISTIKLANALKVAYPNYHFVPIYWMASEDHDFAEINHFHLFGKRYTWESEQLGAVGRFTTEGLQGLLEEIPEVPEIFRAAYQSGYNLAEATRYFVHKLFGESGLLCLDADNAELKAAFVEIMKDDLRTHSAARKVQATSEALSQAGYKNQVHPREINLFYLEKGSRERIVREGEQYQVLNRDKTWNWTELETELAQHPERFSPNVVLRPVYQEVIMPNIAYTGGPGELAYWLQLKEVFAHYQVPMPILMPRSFALIFNKSSHKRYEKLNIDLEDLFLEEVALRQKYVEDNSQESPNLDAEKELLAELFDRIDQQANQIDPTLSGFVGAEHKRNLKSLENIEKRLKKAQESKFDTEIKQLIKLKEALFPEQKLQERHDNFLNFYLNNSRFLAQVAEHLAPFRFEMNILLEDF